MAASMQSTASSPLSDPGSDQFEGDDFYAQEATETQLPPAKRQRVGENSMHATPSAPEPDYLNGAYSPISSDTDGDVPQSPGTSRLDEDEEQVTVCAWEGCDVGDLGTMDNLVQHIHDEHVEARQKKYTCEWHRCIRQSMPHASAYALKAHIRSHTREKPFYCLLPECDRSFTRSDALAKHMRTVHETEALRPSDPVPKSMQPLIKSGTRLKLVVKPNNDETSMSPAQSPGAGLGVFSAKENPYSSDLTSFSSDLGFTPEELALSPRELFQLLRRQVHWAEEELDGLKRECETVEAIRKKEWIDKEILLDQVIKNELDWHDRRAMVLASLPPTLTPSETRVTQKSAPVESADTLQVVEYQGGSSSQEFKNDQEEAAAVLASMAKT